MYVQLPQWETDPIGFVIDRLFPDQRVFANKDYWEKYPEHRISEMSNPRCNDHFSKDAKT